MNETTKDKEVILFLAHHKNPTYNNLLAARGQARRPNQPGALLRYGYRETPDNLDQTPLSIIGLSYCLSLQP